MVFYVSLWRAVPKDVRSSFLESYELLEQRA